MKNKEFVDAVVRHPLCIRGKIKLRFCGDQVIVIAKGKFYAIPERLTNFIRETRERGEMFAREVVRAVPSLQLVTDESMEFVSECFGMFDVEVQFYVLFLEADNDSETI